jgi:hypothetical protein
MLVSWHGGVCECWWLGVGSGSFAVVDTSQMRHIPLCLDVRGVEGMLIWG